MKTLQTLGLLALAMPVFLTACQERGPVEPLTEEALSTEDLIAVDLLGDAGSTEAALVLADAGLTAAPAAGRTTATQLATRARTMFRAAEDALLGSGDRVRAAEEARLARQLVADAVQTVGGHDDVVGLVDRITDLVAAVELEGEAYREPSALAGDLTRLAELARARLKSGDLLGAAATGVLAVQRHDQQRDHVQDAAHRHDRAKLAVRLGRSAVALAARILEAQGADEQQLRLLALAREYQAAATAALEAGHLRRAVHLAEQAQWTALRAVVAPGGVTREEARAMSQLARQLFEGAIGAVGDDPTPLEAALLKRARRLIEIGEAKLAEGKIRGIAQLWRSAVISAFLIG